jgi:hypothetical protein
VSGIERQTKQILFATEHDDYVLAAHVEKRARHFEGK